MIKIGDITAHFDRREFTCKCGCGTNNISTDFVKKLEQIYEYLSKCNGGVSAIIVNSGCRCAKHSESVGGYRNDAHVRGFAADINAIMADKKSHWTAYEIAAVAEKVGLQGIGIITNYDCHVDDRNVNNYTNGHWFGNEMTGNDNIPTFAEYLPKQNVSRETNPKHKIKVYYDDKLIIESEV